MSAPTDRCADLRCGHARRDCACPAFDEGAPKKRAATVSAMADELVMLARVHADFWSERTESEVKRAFLAVMDEHRPPPPPVLHADAFAAIAALLSFPSTMCHHAATPCSQCDAHEAAVRTVQRFLWEAASAKVPTRIQAAERAVVEAALIGGLIEGRPWPGYPALVEAVARLRSLREGQAAEECGAIGETDLVPNTDYPDEYRSVEIRCHLPRGHEGEHCGPLGDWRWT